MNVRTLMANAVFLVLPALLAACSDASRPPAVSFKIQNVPPVPRTMSQMSREVHISRDFMSPRSRARAPPIPCIRASSPSTARPTPRETPRRMPVR